MTMSTKAVLLKDFGVSSKEAAPSKRLPAEAYAEHYVLEIVKQNSGRPCHDS